MSHAPDRSFWKRIPRKWLFVFLYALLASASYAFRQYRPYERPLAPGQVAVMVREFDADSRNGVPYCDPTGREIRVALRDLPAKDPSAPTLLLLHGTPGDSRKLASLTAALEGRFRLLVPDLPGNGSSERSVADYSIECAAHEMFELLDRRGVKQAHVLGVGLGGGVALEMSASQPARVKSLSLVSSVGSQEFDLMGNGFVNKIVYFFQTLGVHVIKDGIPHFGLLDGLPFDKSYANALWESDLMPLKEDTHDWHGPLLLAHGEDDWLVAPDTAHYAESLAPQAEPLFVPGGHHVFLTEAATYAPAIADFVDRAEAGKARIRGPKDREPKIPPPPAAHGARHLVLMTIILLCTLVAEDPTCLATGLLVSQGLIDFWSGTAACLVGIFIGDLFLYLVGRILGRAALTKAPFRWFISEYDVDRMSQRFGSTKGMAVIVTSRFIPGSRIPTFVAAGIMKLNPAKLGFLFFIAAALWTPPLVWFGATAGGDVMESFKHFHHLAGWIAGGLLFSIFVVFHYVLPAFTWRGRRELLAKTRRRRKNDGLPGLLDTLALGFRYGPATYAAANPGFGRLGGASGESKAALLAAFGDAPEIVPSLLLSEADTEADRISAAIAHGDRHGWPLVLKPDGAGAGASVHIARTPAEVRAWCSRFREDALVQPYAAGREYEVVWYRKPGETRGEILAVVEKVRTVVTGDGKHTLEHLVWANDDALPDAALFVRLNAGREDDVLLDGEQRVLCDIGSLAKGARVALRRGLGKSASANDRLNALAARHGGLHWLRLDVRADSDETFEAGEGWRITEIEGAGRWSSVAGDPGVGAVERTRLLAQQRAACFAAGAALAATQPRASRPQLTDLLATWSEARETPDIRIH